MGFGASAAMIPGSADLLGVLVLVGTDRMAAPANDDLRLHAGMQRTGIAQQVEDVVGDAGRAVQAETPAVQRILGVDDVAQGAEEHLAGAGDHLAIDEGVGRRVEQFQAHAAILLMDFQFEVAVSVEDVLGVVDLRAGVEDGQGTLAEKLVGTARARFAELVHFTLGEGFEAALGADRGIVYRSWGHAVFLDDGSRAPGRGVFR